jgi:tripartite-type tricarboxylate transporter receptor subunit TctC
VPTIAESGVPGFEYTLWIGLWGHAGIPAPIVNKINTDVRKALASPDLNERLTKLGTLPMDMSPQQFSDFIKREVEETARIVKAAGIQPQ